MIAGIVAEFNPLTKGHEYLIKRIREDYKADTIIVAMSPNFVMRGEVAIFDKFERARLAINFGVDLVLEIPTVYSIQSAETYAYRGIEILNMAHVTDIFFGTERDDLKKMEEIINIESTKEFTSLFNKYRKSGYAFNISYKKALEEIDSSLVLYLEYPNVLLGIEYIKAIKKINPTIKYHPIKRKESDYYSEYNKNITLQSATALRKELYKKNPNPKLFDYDIKECVVHKMDDYFELIKYRIVSSSSNELKQLLGITEGFENKLKKIKEFKDYDYLVHSLISKRDRETKIKRILIAILLNIKKEESKNTPLTYIRVLSFNSVGTNHLKNIKDSCDIIDSIKRDLNEEIYREIDFTKIYDLPYGLKLDKKEYEPIYVSQD